MTGNGSKAGNNSSKAALQPNGGGGSNAGQPNGVAPKVVGPNVKGKKEEYQLVRRLQSALFGGVYEAKGLSSGRDFAIKVLHKSEVSKAEESNSIEFCEVPLSEVRFAELMRGYEHVMEVEEHFEDAYCFYVVFELARGGDLLEALKHKPHGFDEAHAQFLIQQAAKGMAYLHKRRVAMQDVSLENMLLHVNDQTGTYQVKVCDPGQAVVFDVDHNGEEVPVGFRGLVGKSFRPPELHDQQPYSATKVDSWCLGWSTFYLLTAQPLFMSADPVQQDSDWLLFQQGDFATLFQQKSNLCSQTALDFIFRLLQIEPKRRMSINDALAHPWLKDPKISPVMAPNDLLPEHLKKTEREPPQPQKDPRGDRSPDASSPLANNGGGLLPPAGSHGGRELPTWAAASVAAYGVHQTPMLMMRSPPRSPRGSSQQRTMLAPRIPSDRRRPAGPHSYVATAHSPPPRGASGHRAASPLQRTLPPQNLLRSASPGGGRYLPPMDPGSPGMHAPSPFAPIVKVDQDEDARGRAWRMGSGAGSDLGGVMAGRPPTRTASPLHMPAPAMVPRVSSGPYPSGGRPAAYGGLHAGRPAQSPSRTSYQGAGYPSPPRSPSPGAPSSAPGGPGAPGAAGAAYGFSWAQAPAMFSPRSGSPVGTAIARAPSPGAARPMKPGFTWSPEPNSPRSDPRNMGGSPRSFSPAPSPQRAASPTGLPYGGGGSISSGLPRWIAPT